MLQYPIGLKGRRPSRGARLNSSILRRGLVFAAVTPLTYGGSFLRNEISGRGGVLSGATIPTWAANRALNVGGGSNATSHYVDFGTDPQAANLVQPTTGCTFWARIYPLSSASAGVKNLAERNDGNSVNAGWIFGTHGLLVEAQSVNMRVNVADPATGAWCNQCVVFDGSVTAANQKIYRNGILLTHTTDTDGSGVRGSDSANNLYVGRGSFSSGNFSQGNFDGYLEAIYFWNRKLSQTEILLLEADPYALFRTRRQLWAVASAAGVGVGAFVGDSTFDAVGADDSVAGTFAGDSVFSAIADVPGVGEFAGSSTFGAVGIGEGIGVGSFAGDSSFPAIGASTAAGVGEFAGEATFTGQLRNASVDWSILTITVNGTPIDALLDTIRIAENEDETPNVLTFSVLNPDDVQVGNEVILSSGVSSEVRHFGGVVTKKVISKAIDDPRYLCHVTVNDRSWLLSQATVSGKHTSIEGIVSGVSGVSVGSVSIGAFDKTFGDEVVASALSSVTQEAGARWKVDYYGVLSVFVTDPSGSAAPVDVDHQTLEDLSLTETIQRTFNRVTVQGVGTTSIYDQEGVHDASMPIAPDEAFIEGNEGGMLIVDGWYIVGGGAAQLYEPGLPGSSIPYISDRPTPGGGLGFVDGDLEVGHTYAFAITATTDLGETHAVIDGAITMSGSPHGIRVSWLTPPTFGDDVRGGYGGYGDINVYMRKDGGEYLSVGSFSGAKFIDDGTMPPGSVSFEISSEVSESANTPPDSSKRSPASFYYVAPGYPPVGQTPFPAGTSVNVYAVVEDGAAQAEFAALFPFAVSGAITKAITNNDLSYAEAQSLAVAELSRGKAVKQYSFNYTSHDEEAHPGRSVELNYPGFGSLGQLVINTASITFGERASMGPKGWRRPTVQAEASPADNVGSFRFERTIRAVTKTINQRRKPPTSFVTPHPVEKGAAPTTPPAGWVENALPSTSGTLVIRDMIWASSLGLYVGVGERTTGLDRVVTSPDGVTWTLRAAAEANSYRGVTWSPTLGLLVAVSSTGTNRVMTSPDGITWTARAAASVAGWNAVTWSSSLALLCAVGGTNAVMTSPDGVTWTSRTGAASKAWNSIVWSSSLSLFVVTAGTSGTASIQTSPDGITWTSRTHPSVAFFGGTVSGNSIIAANGSVLAAVARTNNPGANDYQVLTSTDGITWTAQTMPSDTDDARQWGAIVARLGGFAIISNAGTGAGNGHFLFATSPDGTTWTTADPGFYRVWDVLCYSSTRDEFVASDQSAHDVVLVGRP